MSWSTRSLNETSIYLKRGISPKYVDHEGIQVINQKCIRNNVVNFDLVRQSSIEKRVTKEKMIQEGDTLVNSTGTGTLGRTAFVKEVIHPTTVDTHVTIVRPDPKLINGRYLSYQLASKERLIVAMAKGATNQVELSAADLGRLKVTLPPLPTQQKIASILSSYDELIENNLKRIKLLEEAAQNIYKEWFVNFRFPGYESVEFGDDGLPEGWEIRSLSEVFNTSSGGTPSRRKHDYYGGNIRWFKTRELQDNILFDSEENITDEALRNSSAKVFPVNTVLMAMYGATIGRLGILTNPSSTNQACCAIIPKTEYLNHLYIYQCLYVNRDHILSLRMGAAQENISQTIIKELEILVPSQNVLKEFSFLANSNFQLIKNLTFQNQTLKEARDILLPRLMDRRIEV